MYTLEQLQHKNLKELKEIGWQMNVLPAGDKRCRQNWIDALADTQPSLLQLLEVSPGVEIEQVQEPIAQTAKKSPGAKAFPRRVTEKDLERYSLRELKSIARESLVPFTDDLCRQSLIDLLAKLVLWLPPSVEEFLGENFPGVEPVREEVEEVQALEPIEIQALEPIEYGRITGYLCSSKPIEIQALEPIEVQALEPIESKFGRIVYPKPAVKPIAQTEKTTRGETDGNKRETDGSTVGTATLIHLCDPSHHPGTDTAELHGSSGGIESGHPQHKEGDRVLAAAGDGERDKGRALRGQSTELNAAFNDEQPPNRGEGKGRIDPKVSQSAIVPAAKNSPGVSRKNSIAHQLLELFNSRAHIIESPAEPENVTQSAIAQTEVDQHPIGIRSESDLNPILTGLTFSDNFIARYSPPRSQEVHFHADSDGQLNLLDFEFESNDEPPDPDDFESIEAFREAIARWDAQNPEPLAVSLDSMCEWAPCPDDWYEPEVEKLPVKASSMGEGSEVLELSPAIESSSTSDFSIPTFDAWCDRANRQNRPDEPPDTGSFARLPKPKPPGFPPMSVVAGDQANSIRKFARSATVAIGRAPPGGDVM